MQQTIFNKAVMLLLYYVVLYLLYFILCLFYGQTLALVDKIFLEKFKVLQ